MAEVRKVVIEVVQKTEKSDVPKPIPQSEQEQTEQPKENLLKNVIVNQAFDTAKRAIINGVDTSINYYYSLNEDYMGEMTYNNVKSAINKISSFGASVFAGAKLGAGAGPWGAVVGAVIGGIGYGATAYISYATQTKKYQQELNSARVEMEWARKRAGLYDGSKGTEN